MKTWAEVAEQHATRSGLDSHQRAAYELVAKYASDETPDAIRFEAFLRTDGWLRDVNPAIASETSSNESSGVSLTMQYRSSLQGALRGSGALAILAPWKPRRAI